MEGFSLSEAKISAKLMVTGFLIVIALGYLMAVVNVWDKTHFTYQGIVVHSRGNEEEMIYPKLFSELVQTSHVHLLGHGPMFLLMTVILLFTSLGEKLKSILVLAPFIALILDMASLWLTRYVAAGFAGLTLVAGGLMGLSFLALFMIPLYEMWLKKA